MSCLAKEVLSPEVAGVLFNSAQILLVHGFSQEGRKEGRGKVG